MGISTTKTVTAEEKTTDFNSYGFDKAVDSANLELAKARLKRLQDDYDKMYKVAMGSILLVGVAGLAAVNVAFKRGYSQGMAAGIEWGEVLGEWNVMKKIALLIEKGMQ